MTTSNRDRWSQNPYAAMQPHMGALQRSGIRYVNGSPVNFSARAPRPPHVGAPFPPIFIPPFPQADLSPAQPSPQPQNPQLENPQPQPTPGPPDQLAIEAHAALLAFMYEGQGMQWVPEASAPTHTEITIKPYYQKAAAQWTVARDAAAKIASPAGNIYTDATPPVLVNAHIRAQAYENRRQFDQAIVDGQAQRPAPGFQWPTIYQVPDPNAPAPPPIFVPPGPVLPPPPEPTAPPASSGTIVLLALGAAAAYAAFKIFKVG